MQDSLREVPLGMSQHMILFDLMQEVYANVEGVKNYQKNLIYQYPSILILCGHARMLAGADSLYIRFKALYVFLYWWHYLRSNILRIITYLSPFSTLTAIMR